MQFDGFDWDAGNDLKCQKHGVSRAEIESLFVGQPLVGPDPHRTEPRFRAAGRTAERGALFVVFTLRVRAGARKIRPISARYMRGKEIDAYEERVSRL